MCIKDQGCDLSAAPSRQLDDWNLGNWDGDFEEHFVSERRADIETRNSYLSAYPLSEPPAQKNHALLNSVYCVSKVASSTPLTLRPPGRPLLSAILRQLPSLHQLQSYLQRLFPEQPPRQIVLRFIEHCGWPLPTINCFVTFL